MGNNVGYFDINLRSLHISCQMFDSEGDTMEDRETADYLCFVTEGNGWFKLEDAKRCDALKSGAVFRLPKDVKYSYGSKKKDPVKFYAIALDCWDSQKFFAPFGIMKSHPVKYCESKVFSLVEELYETAQLKKIENCYKSISLLYEIFSVISDTSIEPESKGDSNEYIDQALALIHARYYDDINVNMLADAFHLNRSYFSVLFKKKVGVSPHEYLLKFRIMQACKLLKKAGELFPLLKHPVKGFPETLAELSVNECLLKNDVDAVYDRFIVLTDCGLINRNTYQGAVFRYLFNNLTDKERLQICVEHVQELQKQFSGWEKDLMEEMIVLGKEKIENIKKIGIK